MSAPGLADDERRAAYAERCGHRWSDELLDADDQIHVCRLDVDHPGRHRCDCDDE